MNTDHRAWPPFPGEERILRAPPVTFRWDRRRWPTVVVMCAVFDAPLVALLVFESDTVRDWIYGAVMMVIWSGFWIAMAWGYRRRFVRFDGWQVTVRPGWGLTKSADLRGVVHVRPQQLGSGRHCRLRFSRAKGQPRSIAVPMDAPDLRRALLSRLALVPGIAAKGGLRDELASYR